jgi:hypothetical protein
MQVNLVELDLSTLQQLQGGAVFQQVQRLIAAAVTDCENRPTEERPRKVNIQLEIIPVSRRETIDDTHFRQVLDGVKLRLQMDLKCPTRKTMEFDCGVGSNHTLLFNPHNPLNHRQADLPLTFEANLAEADADVVPMTA